MTDIEISRKAKMLPIADVAAKLDIASEELQPYGKHIAKLPLHTGNGKNGNLVLVSAISPTPAGPSERLFSNSQRNRDCRGGRIYDPNNRKYHAHAGIALKTGSREF